MPRTSAGILLFRRRAGELELFLIHHGGPYWAGKDLGSWSIPKGEFTAQEDPLTAARREFREETGFALEGEFIQLRPIKQAGGKIVYAWAIAGDCDAAGIHSNTYRVEWPPRSGKWQSYPEVDRAEWFTLDVAREKINKAQMALIDELLDWLNELSGKSQ